MKKIIAINAGSSSLKFQLFEMPAETVLTRGLFERVGSKDAVFTIEVGEEKKQSICEIADHAVAVELLLEKLVEENIITSLDEIDGIGHRVVHGGEVFQQSTLITSEVTAQIESLFDLAPLHNPANLIGIEAFQRVLPKVPAVAVFDTSFHQTMPEANYLYSIPYEYYQKFSIRKYGFHGTSHQYVSARAASVLGESLEKLKLVTCHLGNGASITAVDSGKSVDTSMGLTPLEGLTMGTRSGNLDPAIIPFLMKKLQLTADEVVDILNKKSGMLGISGISNDLRDIESAASNGDKSAQTALAIFVDRIKKYIGMYMATMGGMDAIVFTAGIGENSATVRENVIAGLQCFGAELDMELNQTCRSEMIVSKASSKVKVLVIPTNEEVMIARDALRLIS